MRVSIWASALMLGLPLPGTAAAQISASAFTTGYRYDAGYRLVGTISPDPDGAGAIKFAAVRNTYNSSGLLTQTERGELSAWQSEAVLPASWSGFTVFETIDISYDSMRRKSKEIRSANGTTYTVTQYSYDGYGRLLCTAVRMNPATFGSLPASACDQATSSTADIDDRITRNLYDPAGQLMQVQQGVGTSDAIDYATYTYSPNGKQKVIIDANGNRAEFAYDGHDRKIKWTFPAANAGGQSNPADYEQYGFDPNGNRTSWRRRDGTQFAYTFDALNRATQQTINGASPTAYSYDLRGLRLSAADGLGTTTFGYDGFGRLTFEQSLSSARLLTYQYDEDSNRTRVTHPDGVYFSYAYDGLDRLKDVQENGSTLLTAITYTARGNRGRVVRAGVISDYLYDPLERLGSLTDDLTGTASDVTLTFAHNPASQITERMRSNDAYRFTGYVPVSRPYTANGLNQYGTAGGASFCHDANGNLTLDGTRAYKYDAENRLTEARAQVSGMCPTVNYTGALQATMAYDALGRLYETTNGGSGVTRFVYSGDELTLEMNSAGQIMKRYVHGRGEDDPLLWYNGDAVSSGNRGSFQVDHQGSIVSLADNAGGLVATNAYDEYGIPNSSNVGRFQYTGQAWIPELGMYHYKARIYSPTLGRFLQTDPVGYDDQINLYAYVANDPLNRNDPTGREAACVTLNTPCLAPGADPFGDLYRFLFGDVEQAIRNPTPFTIGMAAISIAPVGKVKTGASAVFRLASAAETRLAQAALRSAAVESVSALRRSGGRLIASGADGSFRNAGEFAKAHGGRAADYEKVATGTIAKGSDGRKIEVHFVRNKDTGEVWDMKYKIQGGPN